MRDPHADRVGLLRKEAGVQKRALERRDLAEHGGVEDQVAVGRVRSDRKIRVADVEVDRLGPTSTMASRCAPRASSASRSTWRAST